jgi:hypothetical protein
MCNRWYHGACAGTTQDEIDALGSAEWECPECQMHRCAPSFTLKPLGSKMHAGTSSLWLYIMGGAESEPHCTEASFDFYQQMQIYSCICGYFTHCGVEAGSHCVCRAEQRRAQHERQRQKKGGAEAGRRGMRIRAGAGKRCTQNDGAAVVSSPTERKPPRRRVSHMSLSCCVHGIRSASLLLSAEVLHILSNTYGIPQCKESPQDNMEGWPGTGLGM